MIEYLRNKFDYRRPMGRLNYFRSVVVYSLLITILPVSLTIDSMSPPSVETALLLGLYYFAVGIPLQLLGLRRAKAATIPSAFIFVAWGFSIVNLLGGFNQLFSFAIFTIVYGVILGLFLYLMPNKVEPLVP